MPILVQYLNSSILSFNKIILEKWFMSYGKNATNSSGNTALHRAQAGMTTQERI
ncbi:MAG TPA: hypothetical protein VEL11_18770 [Candidatus Bathyarchaeia archaeon]|nr:hypothetical protein [Candidatus Bathyarchaeia archaeon]